VISKFKSNSDCLSLARRMLRGGSIGVLSAALLSNVAVAQDAGGEEDEVIATGIRQSLEDAAAIKRNADVFVDAITAEDIGALPDRSVSEALQRVPGVSVLRFAGPDDPDHFSVEGSGVTIRGLPFVRSELNGRDVFGAGPSGRLGFEDVSPELLGSVQVFKNQSADMIEGGLSGTVDLRTRVPFDNREGTFGYTLDFTYSDFVEEVTPSFSVLGSKSWETGAGEFGLLASFSRNRLRSRSDATQLGDYRARDAAGNRIADEDINKNTLFTPTGGGVRTQDFDRERDAISFAGQWESNDGRWQAVAQFLEADSGVAWTENVLESSIDDNPGVVTTGIGGVGEPIFGDSGLFQSGRITDNSGWRGDDLANGNIFDGGPNVFATPAGGIRQLALARERVERDVTRDFGFNLKFAPNERLRTQLDVQYIDATSDVTDVTVHTAFESDFEATLNGGETLINYVAPSLFDSATDFGEGGTVLDGDFVVPQNGDYFQNLGNYYLRSKMDHVTQSEADEFAIRGDVEYDLDKGWLQAVRIGGRYSERDSLIRESAFNWGNVSEIWTGDDVNGNGDAHLRLNNPALLGLFSQNSFENFQRGGGSGQFPGFFWSGPLASDYEGFLSTIQPILDGVTNAQSRGFPTLANRPGAVSGTPFLPNEINNILTDTYAAYARLDFGNTDDPFANGMSLSGNVGLRWVRTEVDSDGSFSVANISQTPLNPENFAGSCAPQQGGDRLPGICSLSADRLANLTTFFSGDGSVDNLETKNSYDRLLPSLNLKLQLNDEMLIRFGAARSMSRANENDLRSGSQIIFRSDLPEPDPNNPGFNTFTGLTSFSGNPFLNPAMSNQFDLSYEWYFGDANSFTVSAFYKKIEDLIIPTVTVGGAATGGVFNDTTVVANGASEVVAFQQPGNAIDDATFKGFEVAYQQFYDFLPGALSNFGVQANYTYIDDSSPGEFDNSVTGNTNDGNVSLQRDTSNFEQVSEHQFNIAGIYEDEKISARLAYNWRDDFLLVRRDVIFPFSSIFQKATGQLDGSIFYTINDNFKVGLTAVNLLDDVTETEQLINGTVPSGLNVRAPRSFIRNDRRYTLSLRANF